MKIVIVTEYYLPHVGGVEVVFAKLAQGLVQRGHEVSVVTCRVPNTKAYEESDGIKIHRVRVPHKGDRYFFSFLAVPAILKVARNADVIHTTTFNAASPSWLASKFLRKKCVLTVHEFWGTLWHDLKTMNWFSTRLHRTLERLIITLPFDKYVCVSHYTRDRLRSAGISDEKTIAIYNGVDHSLFDSTKSDGTLVRKELCLNGEFVYLYYGRPGVSKGLEYLVQAIPLISDQIPDSRFMLILGNQPSKDYAAILNMLADLNVKDRVTLLNSVPRNRLPEYIAAADCVVVPSLAEGFGFTAAEACSMGKAVVASKVGSLPEVVSGKYVLVEPKNPQAIAEGVSKIHSNGIKSNGRKVFSWDRCVEQYLNIYEQIK